MNPERIPPLVKDYYWDKQDCPIPYTEAAIQFKKKTYRGSADEITYVMLMFSEEKQNYGDVDI